MNRPASKVMVWGALAIILAGGFLLRDYHIDFPSIGYHNMKENESLSIAQEMVRTGDYRTKRVYYVDPFAPDPGIVGTRQLPLVPYQIIASWKAMGENLWAPRLVNVAFGTASILLVFLLARLLLADTVSALFAAAAAAVMPLAVFFSRNLQSESPALFFMLCAQFFYLRFARSLKIGDALAGALSLGACAAYNDHFLIGVVPVLFCLPYRGLFARRMPAAVLVASLCVVAAEAGWLYGPEFAAKEAGRVLEFLTPAYWKTYGQVLQWYTVGENFTWLFCLLAVCGIVLAFFRRAGLAERFLIGWAAAAAVYAALYARELTENSFSQMPFVAGVAFASAFAFRFIAQEARRPVKRDLSVALAVMLLAAAGRPVYVSIVRMYGTVFPGADAAGETLREITAPGERFFLLTYAQGNAVARYAERYAGWPAAGGGLAEFKDKERSLGIKYVCVFPVEFMGNLQKTSPEIFDYLQTSYRVYEAGLIDNMQQVGYLILEKVPGPGGGVLSDELKSLKGAVRPRSIYRMFGRFVFFHSLRPDRGPAAQ